MLEKIFDESGLPQPPSAIGDGLLRWVRRAQEVIDFLLIDEVPVPEKDLQCLREVGTIPGELEWFYQHATPWVRMDNGPELWRQHVDIAYRRLGEAACRNQNYSQAEWKKGVSTAPRLWPVNLSHKATAFAFLDEQGRLAIIDGNIGPFLGRPMALGLRNYLVQQVVVEIVWCDEGYQSYAETLSDASVIEAGCWPIQNPPRHFLIDAYQEGIWTGRSRGPCPPAIAR